MTYEKLLKFLQSLSPEQLKEEIVVISGDEKVPVMYQELTAAYKTGREAAHLGVSPKTPVLSIVPKRCRCG